jgi:hypothetical protein
VIPLSEQEPNITGVSEQSANKRELGEQTIKWHPPFVEAIKAEFADYQDALEFYDEKQITVEPLKIDLLVVKKLKDIVIDKSIGRIFRGHNILEYKSPFDSVGEAELLQSLTYVTHYAGTARSAHISDMTLTIVTYHRPKKVIKLLEAWGGKANPESKGITVINYPMFPIQIINPASLDRGDTLLLWGLRNKLTVDEFVSVMELAYEKRLTTYIGAIIAANKTVLEEISMYKVKTVAQDILHTQVGQYIITLGEQRGEQRGEHRGRQEERNILLSTLRDLGVAPDILEQAAKIAEQRTLQPLP